MRPYHEVSTEAQQQAAEMLKRSKMEKSLLTPILKGALQVYRAAANAHSLVAWILQQNVWVSLLFGHPALPRQSIHKRLM